MEGGLVLNAQTCPNCGGPITIYTTHEHYRAVSGEVRTYPKYHYRCKPCFNARRREWCRRFNERRKDKDYYIRDLLCLRRQPQGRKRPPSFWPQWLVELKRQQLKLLRLCQPK
jgi:hypothetical protein